MQKNITYSYNAKNGEELNYKTQFRFDGPGLDIGISRGRCRIVLSKSPNLDDFTECYSYLAGNQISIPNKGAERGNIIPSQIDRYRKTTGIELENNVFYTVLTSTERGKIPDGKYYQYMILNYVLNPAGKFTVIKEVNNEMINAKNGILYAIKETPKPDPKPEPEKKYDLAVESISISPTTVIQSGSVSVNVQIKNKGEKEANSCYVRFFLSKYQTVEMPYQGMFTTELSCSTLNAGASSSLSGTLFLNSSFAPAGSYYVIADVYSRSGGAHDDKDETNNRKATSLKITGSSRSLDVVSDQSAIRINGITKEDEGGTIFITGSNTRSIKEVVIDGTYEICIKNEWSDPILFITVIDKNGMKREAKINNSKK